jgi:hypothetical protein
MNMNRKADRAALAARLVEIARSLGFEAEAETLAPPARETRVTIEAGALHAWISLHAKSRYSDSFVVPWHVPAACAIPGQYLAPAVFQGRVNEYHGLKATTVCFDDDALVSHVTSVLTAHEEGRAFTTTPPRQRPAHKVLA